MADQLTIVQALAAAMADVTKLGKNQTNTFSNYKFRGIDDVLNIVGPAFRAHLIVPTCAVLDVRSEDIVLKEKPALRVAVTCRWTFHGPAGDSLSTEAVGESFDTGDKATPKAMSVAYRTALLQLFALPTGDPDPDSQSYEMGTRRPRRDEPRRDDGPRRASPNKPVSEAQNKLIAGLRAKTGTTVEAIVAHVGKPWQEWSSADASSAIEWLQTLPRLRDGEGNQDWPETSHYEGDN
ncbi:MAG: ERF family protein [Propionibacteriaceae bacterium]|jgi:hypothetical protein|nr:ERF family protein [Propionibacteriaceae bacterium]